MPRPIGTRTSWPWRTSAEGWRPSSWKADWRKCARWTLSSQDLGRSSGMSFRPGRRHQDHPRCRWQGWRPSVLRRTFWKCHEVIHVSWCREHSVFLGWWLIESKLTAYLRNTLVFERRFGPSDERNKLKQLWTTKQKLIWRLAWTCLCTIGSLWWHTQVQLFVWQARTRLNLTEGQEFSPIYIRQSIFHGRIRLHDLMITKLQSVFDD